MYDIKNIMKSIKDHDDMAKLNKLSCLMEKLIDESSDPAQYEMDIYVLENGYHFNKEMFDRAMEGKEVKWSPDTCESMMNSHGISFTGELKDVTMYDKAYVMNMLYKRFYPLVSDPSTAAKFAEKYIKCEYPVPGGRAFHECMCKHKLEKELMHHM